MPFYQKRLNKYDSYFEVGDAVAIKQGDPNWSGKIGRVVLLDRCVNRCAVSFPPLGMLFSFDLEDVQKYEGEVMNDLPNDGALKPVSDLFKTSRN